MRENLYTPERWENVNPKNKKLMKVYLRSLVMDRRRPRTIDQYHYDLRFFLVWNYLYNEDMSVLNFKKRHFEDFKFYLIEERECSNARINRVISPIRTMMGYAEDDDDEYDDYNRNVAAKVKGLSKVPVRDINFIEDRQIEVLREYLREKQMYKYMFALDLFYDSGARVSEILQVKKVDTLMQGYTNKVVCKGGEPHYLLLHERAREGLLLYLAQRGEDDVEGMWVKFKHDKQEITVHTIRDWVRCMANILSKLEGKTIKIRPHDFRHSVIENMGNGSHYLCKKIGRAFTVEEIAILAHHKSIDMTKAYMKPKDDKIIMELFGIKL